MAVPSRSTVSSNVVGGRTGLNTASVAASRCIDQRYSEESKSSRHWETSLERQLTGAVGPSRVRGEMKH
jgi:hypothetical protein